MGGSIGCECGEHRRNVQWLKDTVPTVEEMDKLGLWTAGGWTSEKVSFALTPPPATRLSAAQLEKSRKDARESLASACAGGDPEAIQEAIDKGRTAGLSQAELGDAAAAAARDARRRSAREALAEAVGRRDEASLREAVGLADEADLDPKETEEAVALIEQLENGGTEESAQQGARRRAVAKLEQATGSRSQKELLDAIGQAEGAGLGTKRERAMLAQARVMLSIINARRLAAQERRAKDREGEKTSIQDREGNKTPIRVECGSDQTSIEDCVSDQTPIKAVIREI